MNDVKQVDRDAAATLEPNNGYERDQILRGKRNKGAIVQILAAHRIAAQAAKDAEIAALQARVAELEGMLKHRRKTSYPDDGGLKEPVRSFDETFDGFKMIKEHFFGKEPTK